MDGTESGANYYATDDLLMFGRHLVCGFIQIRFLLDDRMERIDKCKAEANAQFTSGDYETAAKSYTTLLSLLAAMKEDSKSENEKILTLWITIKLNLSLTHLKLADCDAAFDHADAVIRMNSFGSDALSMPTQTCMKAFFRKGQALETRALHISARDEDVCLASEAIAIQNRLHKKRKALESSVAAVQSYRNAIAIANAFDSNGHIRSNQETPPDEKIKMSLEEILQALHSCRRRFMFPCSLVVHKDVDVQSVNVLHGYGLRVADKSRVCLGRVASQSFKEKSSDEEGPVCLNIGTVVLSENPLLLVHSASDNYRERFAAAVAKLLAWRKSETAADVENYDSVLSLHADNHLQTSSETAEEKIEETMCGAWLRNAMKINEVDFRIDEDIDFMNGGVAKGLCGAAALFRDASRINHSCQPNCVQFFNPSSGRVSIVALRPIHFGEEITIAYCPPICPREEKTRMLKFSCGCSFCSGELAALCEQIICPTCSVAAVPHKMEVESTHKTEQDGTATDPSRYCCGLCRQPLPLVNFIETVEGKIQEAKKLCNEENTRVDGMNLLIAVLAGSAILGPYNHLRFKLYLEILAAGVAGARTLNHISKLLEVNAAALHCCSKLLPPRWPLTTGLTMQQVYLQGLHGRLTFAQKAAQSQEFSHEWIKENESQLHDEIKTAVCRAFEDHHLLHEPNDLSGFWFRYRPELESIGILDVEDFDDFMA